MQFMEKVEVIAIRPHIERQRRWTDDKYFVKPGRAQYLIDSGRVKIVSVAEAEVKAAVEAEALVEAETKAAEEAKLTAQTLDELIDSWIPRQSPENYLKRWPEGPHSLHARVIMAKLAEEEE
jgi:hypothetical protein